MKKMKLGAVAATLLVPYALGCSDGGAEEGGADVATTAGQDGDEETAMGADPDIEGGEEPVGASGGTDGSDTGETATGGTGNSESDGSGGESGEEPGGDPGVEPPGTTTDGPLKIVWKATSSVTINIGAGNFNYDVDWDDDGVFDETGVTGSISHEYGAAGDHTVSISGQFPHLQGNCDIDIIQWGNIEWGSFRSSFDRCSGTVISATDIPDLSNVTDMSFAFARSAVEFGPAFSDWDTSNVGTMSNMFRHSSGFNHDISGWDTSSVTDMSLMFWKAFAFNHDIGGWDTSNVTNMRIMFQHARQFNQSLGAWDVAKVTTMDNLFGSSAMDTASYDATLIGWAAQTGLASRSLVATGRTYCDAESARQDLIDTGWTIQGDALQCE